MGLFLLSGDLRENNMKNTNETQETEKRLSKTKIAGRMARSIAKDLAFLVTAPVVGQLPEMTKRAIYREVESTQYFPADIGCAYGIPHMYHKSNRSNLATHISIGSSILGGAVAGSVLHDNPIDGTVVGALTGLMNILPSILGAVTKKINPEGQQKEGGALGSIIGYLVGAPVHFSFLIGRVTYDEIKDRTINYFSSKYREAMKDGK